MGSEDSKDGEEGEKSDDEGEESEKSDDSSNPEEELQDEHESEESEPDVKKIVKDKGKSSERKKEELVADSSKLLHILEKSIAITHDSGKRGLDTPIVDKKDKNGKKKKKDKEK